MVHQGKRGGPSLYYNKPANPVLPVVTTTLGSLTNLRITINNEKMIKNFVEIAIEYCFFAVWCHGLGSSLVSQLPGLDHQQECMKFFSTVTRIAQFLQPI